MTFWSEKQVDDPLSKLMRSIQTNMYDKNTAKVILSSLSPRWRPSTLMFVFLLFVASGFKKNKLKNVTFWSKHLCFFVFVRKARAEVV